MAGGRKIFIIFPITGSRFAVFQPGSTKVAEPAVPLIQFLGLIKRGLVLVKLLRAGIEGVGLVIHLVWDELPIVSVPVQYRTRIFGRSNGARTRPERPAGICEADATSLEMSLQKEAREF